MKKLENKCIDCNCDLTDINRVNNKNSRGWRLCKKCLNTRAREKHNKLKIEKGINYYKKYQLKSSIKNRYGITLEQFDEMVFEQNGVCAICNGINTDGRRLHINHSHKTGKIRGLLCARCNQRLEVLEDKQYCIEAEKYLERTGG